MATQQGLSHDAYGGIAGKDYVPFVSAKTVMPEFTIYSVVIGAFLAVLFGAANTYLGLKVGMTVSASIPAAVMATALFKLFGRNNILENNITQTVASTGEAVAGGIIFTVPALFLWGLQVTILQIVAIAVLGGTIGILFVIPLRRYLTIDEHGTLPYPEGMACAEVLVNTGSVGAGAKVVFAGMGLGAIYKFLSGGLGLWSESASFAVPGITAGIFSFDTLASLFGVGLIVGFEISAYMLAGGMVAWLVLIPIIKYFGAGLTLAVFPSTELIKDMSAAAIWSKYIRYIGAGAVAAGGFISLIKSLPTIYSSFKAALTGLKSADVKTTVRMERDLSMKMIGIGILIVLLAIILLPGLLPGGVVGALCVLVFGFFFAAVSARITGIVGVSNNPVSGMTIATLLVTSALLKAVGWSSTSGMIAAITIGAIVCVAISVAGSGAQNLKTNFIIGGTPKYVEIATIIGIALVAAAIGYVLFILNAAYGIGSKEIAAPQATLMSMVIKGVFTGSLPWNLVSVGVVLGLVIELMGLPVLPFALGLYLPLSLSGGVMVGGIVRWMIDRQFKGDTLKEKVEKAILWSSGLIAGDALIGIVIAVFAFKSIDIGVFAKNPLANSDPLSLLMFIGLAIVTYLYVRGTKRGSKHS